MEALWDAKTCTPWHRALDKYSATVAAYGSVRLVELDNWVQHELSTRITRRSTPFVTIDELVCVTEWKMLRGVWRPRNLQLVRGNPPEDVEGLSAEALAVNQDLKRPITLLTRLAGVGPATASAVLATARPCRFPFFDEVVARQVPQLGAIAFTGPYFHRYADALREHTGQLNERCPHGAWTVHDVDLALWSAVDGKKA